MDKWETRRLALRALVDSFGRGGITRIASTIGIEPNYLSRTLYPPNKKGFKRIGEGLVDSLNEHYPNWLAIEQRAAREYRAKEPATAYANHAASPGRVSKSSRGVVNPMVAEIAHMMAEMSPEAQRDVVGVVRLFHALSDATRQRSDQEPQYPLPEINTVAPATARPKTGAKTR